MELLFCDKEIDGTIDFRHAEELRRIFSLFPIPTAAYKHQIYYHEYYCVVERKHDRRDMLWKI